MSEADVEVVKALAASNGFNLSCMFRQLVRAGLAANSLQTG